MTAAGASLVGVVALAPPSAPCGRPSRPPFPSDGCDTSGAVVAEAGQKVGEPRLANGIAAPSFLEEVRTAIAPEQAGPSAKTVDTDPMA